MASTIPAAKQSFLSTQATLLAQPLNPSRTWTATNDASEEALPERAIKDALFHLNHSVQQHCRRVYAPQATRNIAEQIENVYTRDAERQVEGRHDLDDGICRELDLTKQETITELPPSWISEDDIEKQPMEAKRYADAVRQLTQLSEQRKHLCERIGRLNHLKAAIEPLQTTENGTGIQENIVTRNGAVEKELERMRVLLARVGGRVHALPETRQSDKDLPQGLNVDDFDGLKVARKRRVDEFLADKSVFPS